MKFPKQNLLLNPNPKRWTTTIESKQFSNNVKKNHSSHSKPVAAAVRRLLLLSPAGVCEEPQGYREKLRNAPWRIRLMFRLWRNGSSPMMLVRCLPRRRGHHICSRAVHRWVGKSNTDSDTVAALTDYIFYGWTEGRESAGRVSRICSLQVLGVFLYATLSGES